MNNETILIGLSWPYANGELHIGHLGSSLPADILARYFRACGKKVCFVSGSDCFGTPISIQSQKENKKPEEISEQYHQKFKEVFDELDFSFDNYSKTNSDFHKNFAIEFHKQLYKSEYVYKKNEKRLYCTSCNRFLPDRYVTGKCPHCGSNSKGDCCEHCGKVLEAEELISPHCLICGNKPKLKNNYQFYLKLTALENYLAQFFEQRKLKWSLNAINITQRYFNEGLIDRAISRDLDWGVPVPACDCPEKVIYNWAENVLGYLSACKEYCEKNRENFKDYFNNANSKHYYIHAKDNIQFHSIIFPALLIANPNHYHLPDAIFAYEFVTNDGQKISKSKGTDLSAKQLLAEFHVDFIRYYFAKNISDKRDLNFSKQEFINSVNGELINNWGNLINRTLSFVKNKFNGKIGGNCVYSNIKSEIESTFEKVSQALEQGKVSLAVKEIFELVNFSNRFFNKTEPWKVLKTEPERVEELCFQYLNLILNIAILLNPIIPAGTNRIFKCLGLKNFNYAYTELPEYSIGEFDVLYKRI